MGIKNERNQLLRNQRYLSAEKMKFARERMTYGYLYESALNKINSQDIDEMNAVDYVRFKRQAVSARKKVAEIDSVVTALDSALYSIERRIAEMDYFARNANAPVMER